MRDWESVLRIACCVRKAGFHASRFTHHASRTTHHASRLPPMLRWFEHHQVYCPSKLMEARPEDLCRPFEEVFLTTSDKVRLHGWFFPAAAKSARAHLAFLLLHGNAGNISHRLGFCQAWLEL